jgi:cytochrome c peroxidase
LIASLWLTALVATSCGTPDDRAGVGGAFRSMSRPLSREDAYREARTLAGLGRMMFVDASLSASGRLSCASCHDPDHAFAPPNARPVQFGGPDMTRAGRRAAPSLMYLQTTPPFTTHQFDSESYGDDGGPTGGLTWDGRVDRGRAQARVPLLSADEMANASAADVVSRLARSSYAADVRAFAGRDIFSRPDDAFDVTLRALEAYEQDHMFYPYTSKYDAYLSGDAILTPREQHGLALFNDPKTGNCARCHSSARGPDGTPPQFTDYGLVAIGVPRNRAIPANADPNYYDLGLCGPLRTDFLGRADYCGAFKTPSLRNVAARQTFFHNGVFHTLRDVVEFYATRDTAPERWYPRGQNGRVDVFDDLPPPYRANVDRQVPFGQHPGDPPALSVTAVDDIVAFLETLTDGVPPAAAHGPVVK